MVSVGLHLQPCGYRPVSSLCGPHGVCAKATRGRMRISACQCLDGHAGPTCDDDSGADSPGDARAR